MTELFDDTDLRRAFRDFSDGAGAYVRPPGAELAQHDARGRIRTRRLAVICAAAIAVLLPVGILAVAQWRGGPQSLPVPPATEATTAASTTTSPTVTATPTATSTPPPDGEPTPGPGVLLNTTLTLSWSDPSANANCGGTVTITESHSGLMVFSTMPFDIDRDGTNEILADIFCQLGQVGPRQLVATRLDGGTATVLGTVLATAETDGQGNLVPLDGPGVAGIRDYVGLDDGTVRVSATSKLTCCATPQESAVVQQRTYGWTGSSFMQVAGPTTFVADPAVADLVVTVPTLAFSAPENDFRSATLSVMIRNNGPRTASDVSVYLDYGWRIEEPSGGDWARCAVDPALYGDRTRYAICSVGDMAPGQSVTLTLPMRRDSRYEAEERPHFSTYTGWAEVRVGSSYYPAVTYSLTAA
jgi:hypothetical protein